MYLFHPDVVFLSAGPHHFPTSHQSYSVCIVLQTRCRLLMYHTTAMYVTTCLGYRNVHWNWDVTLRPSIA